MSTTLGYTGPTAVKCNVDRTDENLVPSHNASLMPSSPLQHSAASARMLESSSLDHPASSLDANSPSVTTANTPGCAVQPAFVTIWSWQPVWQGTAFSNQLRTATPPIRNAAGTLLDNIVLTTGGYKRNGNFTPLVTTKTLYVASLLAAEQMIDISRAFPTGYTDIPPVYVWWSTGTRPASTIIMNSYRTYSATGNSFESAPTTDGGIRWTLEGISAMQGPFQQAWFRSVYSNEPRLSECEPTQALFAATRPPVAVEGWTLLQATRTGKSQHAQPTMNGPLHTLGTITHSNAPIQARPTSTEPGMTVNVSEEPSRVPATSEPPVVMGFSKASDTTSPPLPHTSAVNSLIAPGNKASASGPDSSGTDRASQRKVQPTKVSVIDHGSKNSAATLPHKSQPSRTTAHPVPQITLENSQVVQPIPSGGYALRSGPSLVPGGPATVFSGTTYSLLQSGGAIIVNSQTIPIPKVSAKAVGTSHDLQEISMKGSKVLYEGHTLAFTSTLTLGSGNVVTRLALGTNSVGQTVLLGDSVTLSRSNGLSRYAVPSSSSDQTVVVPKIPSKSPDPPSSTSKSASNSIPWIVSMLPMMMVAITLLGRV